jgi:hypothetical protein
MVQCLHHTLQLHVLTLWKRGWSACRRLLGALSNCILYTLVLLPAGVEPDACDVHLSCSKIPSVYLMLNTDMFYVNTTFTEHGPSMNTIFVCNTDTTTTRPSAQQATETDWLMWARDSRCADAFKTQPLSFGSRMENYRSGNNSSEQIRGTSTRLVEKLTYACKITCLYNYNNEPRKTSSWQSQKLYRS